MQMYNAQNEMQKVGSSENLNAVFVGEEKTPQPKILNLNNTAVIINACEDALKKRKFIGISGEAGLGKSTALEWFRDNNENVFLVTIKPSMKPKQFWISVFESILEERKRKLNRHSKPVNDDSDLDTRTYQRWLDQLCRETELQMTNIRNNPDLYFILTQIIKNVQYTGGLVILDESGQITDARLLRLVQEIREGLRKHAGIIMAGPAYFKRKLIKWSNANVDGVPELYSRISHWEDLQCPTKDEVRKICKAMGVVNDDFIRELQSCKNFRRIYLAIDNHLQELEEIKNELSHN